MKRCGWRADFACIFAESLGNDAEIVSQQVREGSAQLWQFQNPRLNVVTRVERAAMGNELVIVAAEGAGLRKHWPQFWAAMEPEGFASYRLHTRKPAVVRLMKMCGFSIGETVMYRTASNGQ